MTVSSATRRNDYIGDGSTDTYAYQFKVFNKTHLVVTQKDTAGVETVLTVDVDYTVSGVGEASGGNVTLLAGNLPLNYELAIVRELPLTQLTDFLNQGEFLPETHEDEFDRSRMIDLQQQDGIDRGIKIRQTDFGDYDTELPGLIPYDFLRVNAAGDGFYGYQAGDAALQIPADGSVSTPKIVDDAVTAAKLNADTAGDGLVQAGSGALDVNADGSTLEVNADVLRVKALGVGTAQLADTAVTSAKLAASLSLLTVDAKILNKRFNAALYNGGSLDKTAVDNAVAAAAAAGGGIVELPAGTWTFSDGLASITADNIILVGQGDATVLVPTENTSDYGAINFDGGANCGLHNLKIVADNVDHPARVIRVDDCSGFKMSGVNIYRSGGDDIPMLLYLAGTSNGGLYFGNHLEFQTARVSGEPRGIIIAYSTCTNNRFFANEIINAREGIIDYGKYNACENNYFAYGLAHGGNRYALWSLGSYTRIIGNTIVSLASLALQGGILASGTKIVANGNVVDASAYLISYGGRFVGSSSECSIEGNIFVGSITKPIENLGSNNFVGYNPGATSISGPPAVVGTNILGQHEDHNGYDIDDVGNLDADTIGSPTANPPHFDEGLQFFLSTANVSNPPTNAELDSAFGAPETLGNVGAFVGVVDDAGAGANVYLVVGITGQNWWQVPLVVTT